MANAPLCALPNNVHALIARVEGVLRPSSLRVFKDVSKTARFELNWSARVAN